MKKLLWIVIGTFFLSQSVIADGIATEQEFNPLQEKIVHHVAANQNLIGLAVTDEELSAMEANPELYLPPIPPLSTQKDILSRQLELMASRGQITVRDMNRVMADMESVVTDYSDDERTASMDAVKDGDTKSNTYCGGIFCTTTVYVWIGGKWRIISVVTYLSIWPYTVIKQQ